MKQDSVSTPDLAPGRHFQIFDKQHHDPGQENFKLSEPAVCSNCGAVYAHDHWQWIASPIDAYLTRCPACKRIHQKRPAAYVTIQGDFAHDHRNEILSLIHHLEARENAEHPLQRIMWVEYQEGGLTITCTETHLARSIGDALHEAYKGELNTHFNASEYLLRVRWRR